MKNLVFVYNADAGFFNALTDSVHKMMSPETYACNLCALTYGPFGAKKEWKTFLEGLEKRPVFLHKDEFLKQHPDVKVALPAVFDDKPETLQLLISADEINACKTLEALKTLIHEKSKG